MAENPALVVARRADFVERVHRGAFAVATPEGEIVAAVGDVERLFLARSAIKLFQALPLVESGAADAARLGPDRLALACASHQGSTRHAAAVERWLDELELGEGDLMCGPQSPADKTSRFALREAGEKPTQLHNNCSGKHAGFLTVAKRLGAPTADYIDIGHPVQKAAAEAFAEATGQEPPLGWAVDGCSAPNFAARLTDLARAAARAARPDRGFRGLRAEAARRLYEAMAAHPFEVAGDDCACTELIEAAEGRAVVKGGAEGAYLGYLRDAGLGFALKIDDGSTEAAECAMAALLVRFGAVSADDPRVKRRMAPKLVNRRGIEVGKVEAAPALTGD